MRRLVALCILAWPSPVWAQQESPDSGVTTRAGVYTDSQAARGKEIYLLHCVSCHSAASHTGPVFAAKWDRQSLWDLYRYVSQSMPKSEPGSLTPREYSRVVAYLLKMNDLPAGPGELLVDSTALKKVRIELKPR